MRFVYNCSHYQAISVTIYFLFFLNAIYSRVERVTGLKARQTIYRALARMDILFIVLKTYLKFFCHLILPREITAIILLFIIV